MKSFGNGFFTLFSSLEIHSGCYVYQWFVLFCFVFILLSSIPWYRYTTVCLSVLKGMWIVSKFCILWMKLLWIFIQVLLVGVGNMNFHFFVVNAWLQLINHMAIPCLVFLRNCQNAFHSDYIVLYSSFSTSLPAYGVITIVFILATLIGM